MNRIKPAILLFSGFLLLGILPDFAYAASWYSSSWQYRKAITISASKVATTTSAFPVLIDLTDTNLAASAQSSGNDILFTASDGTTKLNHEIEKYTNTTGPLTAWVSSDVSSTTDTTIYMYYGNASASSQQNATSVWDSNFVGVWHLHNAASTTNAFTDSTTNANYGSGNGGASLASTTAKLDGGYSFDGSNDYVSAADSVSLSPTAALTVSVWANQTSAAINKVLVSKQIYLSSQSWALQTDTVDNSKLIAFIPSDNNDSGNWWGRTPTGSWTTGVWHHVAFVYNGAGTGNAGKLKVYIDGVNKTLTFNNAIQSSLVDSTAPVTIGNVGTSNYWNGALDEVEISNTNRHSSWITTEYNNQSSTSTFYTVGVQETPSTANTNPELRLTRDTSPPVVTIIGSGVLPTGIRQTMLMLTTDENAVCKYSTLPQSYYDMIQFFQSTGGQSHSTLVPLPPDQAIATYYVTCRDDPWWNVMGSPLRVTLTIAIPTSQAIASTTATTTIPIIPTPSPLFVPSTALSDTSSSTLSTVTLNALVRHVLEVLALLRRFLEIWTAARVR